MFNAKYYENSILSKSRTFVEMFKLNGYYTVGTGKIGHTEKPNMFDLWGHDPNYGPIWRENGVMKAHPTVKEPMRSYGPVDGSFGRMSTAKDYITDTDGTDVSKSGWSSLHKVHVSPMRYVSDDDRDPTPDEANADFTVEQLESNAIMKHVSWFLAVGFVRPHTPLHVPDKYFDFFKFEDVKIADGVKPGDFEDTHFVSVMGEAQYSYLEEAYGLEDGLKMMTQAYLACTYAMDEQVGKVTTALEDNGFSENTIVAVVSDHGWHNGEKQVTWKNTVWDAGAGIPLVIKDPDYPPNHVQFPVSMIDVYPTLIDLAGLEITNTLIEEDGHVPDGYSLKPFMADPSYDGFERQGAISVISGSKWEYTESKAYYGNPKVFAMTVRMKDHRYVLAKNGLEELYHNAEDPYEWDNLLATSDMKTEQTQEVKRVAIDVLNAELKELDFGTIDAEHDLHCGDELWVDCP